MQHNSDTCHVVKAFLPCALHHAMHAKLVARHETWQQWLVRKAEEDLASTITPPRRLTPQAPRG